MTPSIETRLSAIAGALEHLIIPALADADSIVQEQASLALGHLRIIEQQLPHVGVHHLACLSGEHRLAREMLACAAGGEQTAAAADAVRAAADAATARFGDSSAAREDRNAVARALSDLVIASSNDGTAEFLKASQEVMIRHGLTQTLYDRAWFGPTGLDPFAAGLPSIAQLVARETRELNERVAA